MYRLIFRVSIVRLLSLLFLGVKHHWIDVDFHYYDLGITFSLQTLHRRNHGWNRAADVVGLSYFLVDVAHFCWHWYLPCMFRRKTAHHLWVSTRKSRHGYRSCGHFINGDLLLGLDLAWISGGSVRPWVAVVCCYGGHDAWIHRSDIFVFTRPLSIETD